MSIEILPMEASHFSEVLVLQQICFPEPFPQSSLWTESQLHHHRQVFPAGQLVAVRDEQVMGSCSNLVISDSNFSARQSWQQTVGGPLMESHSSQGSTLYGADISVHPDYQRKGVGRALYEARFALVESLALTRFATACRMPDFLKSNIGDVRDYARLVASYARVDRTLTPLLRVGLIFVDVIEAYMPGVESGDAAALLVWEPT